MSRSEDLLISAILRGAGVRSAMRLGVNVDLFLKRKPEWLYLEENKGVSKATFKARFPDFRILKVDPEELEVIIKQTQKNRADYELGQIFFKYQKRLGKDDPIKLASKMAEESASVINRFSAGGDINVVEEWEKIYQHVEQNALASKNGTVLGLPFGIPTLDQTFGGIRPPDLMTIVARQGEFKTWMSLYIATQCMVAGAKVMYISLEMSKEQLSLRMHTLLSRILAKTYKKKFRHIFSNMGLMTGSVDLKAYRKFLLRTRRMFNSSFIIPEARSAYNPATIRGRLEQHKPDVLFFDYFGLSVGDSKVDNWVEARNTSRQFKQICLDYDIPIILNAQANRSAADAKDVPALHQIGLTDSIGADSDRVLSLRLRRGELTMGVIKNRHGPQDFVLHFNLDIDKGVIEEIIQGKDKEEEE